MRGRHVSGAHASQSALPSSGVASWPWSDAAAQAWLVNGSDRKSGVEGKKEEVGGGRAAIESGIVTGEVVSLKSERSAGAQCASVVGVRMLTSRSVGTLGE